MTNIPSWPYENSATETWTVMEWKNKRFSQCYLGFDVRVNLGDGNEAVGNMILKNVRDSYL